MWKPEGGIPFSGRAGRTLFGWLESRRLDESPLATALHLSPYALFSRTRMRADAAIGFPRVKSSRVAAIGWTASCASFSEASHSGGRLAIERFLTGRAAPRVD